MAITFYMRDEGEAVLPSLSTDQLAAFVELAHNGNIREAAAVLHVSEQGLRSRLLALESRLGVELYRKQRGVRRVSPLTPAGERLLPHAVAFLDRAAVLTELFDETAALQEVHVVASHYVIAYALIDVLRRFHAVEPAIRVRLSARTEREVEDVLRSDPRVSIGIAAPYEAVADLEFRRWFTMEWSLVTRRNHPLLDRSRLRLEDLIDEPLLVYERGSTGREHVLTAFRDRGLVPRIEMEVTNTDLAVRLVEAGLGVAIVPLHPSGAVTRGRRVGVRPLGRTIRPIDTGILLRRDESPTAAARRFAEFCSSTDPTIRAT